MVASSLLTMFLSSTISDTIPIAIPIDDDSQSLLNKTFMK